MNKHQRALKAARAAKRIPIVGATVVLEPLVEAAASGFSGGASDLTRIAAWQNFMSQIKFRYAGVSPGTSNIDGGRLIATYLPIGIYLLALKTGISRPISRVLGKVGLRF